MGERCERASPTRRGVLRTAAGVLTVSVASTDARAQQPTIAMTDDLVFDPDQAQVQPGTTVVWENVGSIAHSVTAYETDIPADATYFASGGFESESAARSAYPEGSIESGGTYEHTFEVEGEYDYFCIPHEAAGMTGTITVGGGGGTAGGGGTGGGGAAAGGPPSLPESAKTIGVAITAAMSAVLGLAYFFLKYGGDYGGVEE